LPGKLVRVNDTAQNLGLLHEGRTQSRTHLFVAATLYADAGSAPVHIRNMSPSGALIEAAVLPEPGVRISLRRGRLHATGRIAWRVNRRAGVCLDAKIHVAEWMARQGSVGQAQVDATIARVKAGAGPSETGMAIATDPDPTSIEMELTSLRSDLSSLENELIGDPILVATHPEIQNIDICLQRVDRVLHKLRSGG
jgi:hypothetical protein